MFPAAREAFLQPSKYAHAMGGLGLVAGVLWAVLLGSAWLSEARGGAANGEDQGTIAFATFGRAHFAFDLYGVAVPDALLRGAVLSAQDDLQEAKLTDGVSINYNGQFVEGEDRSTVLGHLKNQGVNVADDSSLLVFVSERDGSTRIYFNLFLNETQTLRRFEIDSPELQGGEGKRREISQTVDAKSGIVVVDAVLSADRPVLFDRPSVVGEHIVYVSTSEALESPRQSWAAVYSTSLKTQATVRLTPKGVADFSPAISPSGIWVAVASAERRGILEDTEELVTDLYVYKSQDGSHRRMVMKHGGWPSWGDDHTIFFHRLADDGWWSIFQISLPAEFLSSGEGKVQEQRITPPGMHAVTPAASPTGKWVAVATRRPGSQFRHVEIFDLASQSFVKLTQRVSPSSNHYNPFVSSLSGFVGYHRCRGNPEGALVVPLLQPVQSPLPCLTLLRVDGTFPSFSPDGSLLAFIQSSQDDVLGPQNGNSGIYVSNVNGTGKRNVFPGHTFSTAWDWKRKGVLYSSYGLEFQSTDYTVHVISVHNVHGEGELSWKQLTKSGNNAFPSPSPDGKYVVFRSGRSGYKNLYIMDAVDGEDKEIWQLTDGPWIDQHPTWSPSGEWIAFASNRENPSEGVPFSVYLIHPDGTGLHKVLHSSKTGLAVHPWFSPDGKKLVFASNLASVSGEPVSVPHQFEPSGELFVANVDGSNIQRLTHNGWEDSTPTWSPSSVSSAELAADGQVLKCNFDDTTWLDSETQIHSSFSRSYNPKLPPIRC